MRPRVFVSSVMEGFEDYREAARNGILDAGGEPVLVEDYPGLSISPRSACLDGVASCDVLVVVVGNRGGWTAPSGKLVVEEEYDEARQNNLRVLAFIQNIKREEEAQRLVDRLSDYINGLFRLTFSSPTELRSAVKDSLEPIIQHLKNPEVELSMIEEKLKDPYKIYNEASLRFLLAPERVEEFIDPVSLESPALRRQLFEIGHSGEVELFSYERPKKTEVGINEIVILQANEDRRWDGLNEVRLELTTTGVIAIDSNITGLAERAEEFASMMVILEGDIADRLMKCFAFASAFFELKDQFRRYDRMIYNAALSGIGHRTLMSEPPKGSSYSMGQHGDEVVIAFDRPQVLTREDLSKSERQVERTITLFRRRLKS